MKVRLAIFIAIASVVMLVVFLMIVYQLVVSRSPSQSLAEYRAEHPTHPTQTLRDSSSDVNVFDLSGGLDGGACSKVVFASQEMLLGGYILSPAGSGPHSAVMYCHGGTAAGPSDLMIANTWREAGFVVFVPTWRGENGNAGAAEFAFGEASDAVEALEYLASRPNVDPDQIFVAGHSVGGTIALLAAELSTRPRAVMACGATPDMQALFDKFGATADTELPFSTASREEAVARSPGRFVKDLNCPARLYYGEKEPYYVGAQARRMKSDGTWAGKTISVVAIEAKDHFDSIYEAVFDSVQFFKDLQTRPRQTPAPLHRDFIAEKTVQSILKDVTAEVASSRSHAWGKRPVEVVDLDWQLEPDPVAAFSWDGLEKNGHLFELKQTHARGRWGMHRAAGFIPQNQELTLFFWDLQSGQGHRLVGKLPNLVSLSAYQETNFAGISPDGRWYGVHYASGELPPKNAPPLPLRNWISVHEIADGNLVRIVPNAEGCVFTGAGKMVIDERIGPTVQDSKPPFRNDSFDLRIVDVDADVVSEPIHVDAGGNWATSPGGHYLLVAYAKGNYAAHSFAGYKTKEQELKDAAMVIEVWDIASQQRIANSEFRIPYLGTEIVFSDDCQRFAMLAEKDLYVWDFASGQLSIADQTQTDGTDGQHRDGALHRGDNVCSSLSWVGSNLLLNNRFVVRPADGLVLWEMSPKSSDELLSNRDTSDSARFLIRVGSWVKIGTAGRFCRIPLSEIEDSLNVMEANPTSNLIKNGRFRLELSDSLSELDRTVVSGILAEALGNAFGSRIVWDDNAAAVLQISYSEDNSSFANYDPRSPSRLADVKTLFNEKPVRVDLTTIPIKAFGQGVNSELGPVEVTLEMKLLRHKETKPIWMSNVTGFAVPQTIELTQDIPAQLRTASIGAAVARAAGYPVYLPEDPGLVALPGLTTVPDNALVPGPLSEPTSSSKLNTDWLTSDLGMPAGRELVHLHLPRESSRNIVRAVNNVCGLHFVASDSAPELILSTINGGVIKVTSDSRTIEIRKSDEVSFDRQLRLPRAQMRLSPAKDLWVVLQADKVVCSTEFSEGAQLRSIPVNSPLIAADFTGDGKTLVGLDLENLLLWDVASLKNTDGEILEPRRIPHGLSQPQFISVAQKANVVMLANSINVICIDLESENRIGTTLSGSIICDAEISPDASTICLIDLEEVAMMDVETGMRLCSVGQQKGAITLCFSPDGSKVLVGSLFDSVTLFETAKLQILKKLPVDANGSAAVLALAWNASGTSFAACCSQLRVWAVE